MLNILLVILLFILFFSYAISIMNILFPFTVLSIVIIFIIKKRSKIIILSTIDLMWLLCVGISIFGLIKTESFYESLTFIGILFSLILLKISLSNDENWKKFFLIFSILFSSVHVFSTLLQYFYPSVIQNINQIILSTELANINNYQLSIKKFAGITGQVGANAFYITIFMSIIFSYILTHKNKIVFILIYLVSLIALILTGKAGLLIFNILTNLILIIVVQYTSLKRSNRKKLYCLLFLTTTILLIILLSLFGIENNLTSLLVEDSGTLERFNIYKRAYDLIRKAPFFGNGLGSVEDMIGIKAHNIYLQLWAELGLLSALLYIIVMGASLFNTIKTYIYMQEKKDTSIIFILISIYIQVIFLLYGLTGNGLYDYFILGIYIISLALPSYIKLNQDK